jgi:hypothetical protein
MPARSAAPRDGPGPGTAGATAGSSRKWLILAVICVSYLMITLDLTVMNLALPSAQHALRFTNADRQWVVTAYALSFGSLLLFCGRLADLIGRKVTFLIGLAGFAAASAAGGASVSFTMLVTARACQGVFAAIAITGGVLLLGRQPKTPGARLDVPGVALVSGGMFCLVYGFSNAATHGWRAPSTAGFLAAGIALLIIFALWQWRAAQPLLPPRVVADRNRGGAYRRDGQRGQHRADAAARPQAAGHRRPAERRGRHGLADQDRHCAAQHDRGRRRHLRRAAAPRPAEPSRGDPRPRAVTAGHGSTIVTCVTPGLLVTGTAPSAAEGHRRCGVTFRRSLTHPIRKHRR